MLHIGNKKLQKWKSNSHYSNLISSTNGEFTPALFLIHPSLYSSFNALFVPSPNLFWITLNVSNGSPLRA